MRFSGLRITSAILTSGLIVGLISAQERAASAPIQQVLFVCEHGNVKSLMATSYFNRLAQERGLPFSSVSRGTEPDSTTVPSKIMEGLKSDGFDVTGFHPTRIKAADVAASQRVVTIGVSLPSDAKASKSKTEKWDDVPPASVDFTASRDSLMTHVKKLVDQLANTRGTK